MKKANKKRFIVLLCVALLFFIGAAMLLFVPEPKPLKITEKITAVDSGGEYRLQGKIKNVSKKEVVLDSTTFRVRLSVQNESGKAPTEITPTESVTLKPNEEFDLSALSKDLGNVISVKVNKVIFTPEHTDITIYGNVINDGKFAIIAFFAGVAGVVFLIVAVTSYRTDVRNTKRVNKLIQLINETFENGIYAAGYYGSKSKNRSAAAKTTASVLGAAVSTLFIGFGRYRVYSNNPQIEFAITESAIYVCLNGKFTDVTNELKSAFTSPAVKEKKNKISVNGENKDVYLTFTAKDGYKEKVKLLNYLQNIFNN